MAHVEGADSLCILSAEDLRDRWNDVRGNAKTAEIVVSGDVGAKSLVEMH